MVATKMVATKKYRITERMLLLAGACKDQRDVFARRWPKSATISLAVIRKAAEIGLDLTWFAEKFLKAPAEKAYDEATAPAWKAYKEATAPALKAYDEATAPA